MIKSDFLAEIKVVGRRDAEHIQVPLQISWVLDHLRFPGKARGVRKMGGKYPFQLCAVGAYQASQLASHES